MIDNRGIVVVAEIRGKSEEKQRNGRLRGFDWLV